MLLIPVEEELHTDRYCFPTDFRTNKPSDVISTLVSIYDSKELFVKELQVLLAQRLLAITDGNYDSEVRIAHCQWYA